MSEGKFHLPKLRIEANERRQVLFAEAMCESKLRWVETHEYCEVLYFQYMETKQYVCLAKCADDTIYVGCTQNIENRLDLHNSGQVKSTKNRTLLILETYLVFNNKDIVFRFEKYLKTGSGRAFLNKRLTGKKELK